MAAQYTRIITPAIANMFRVGLNYWTDYRAPQNHEFDPSKIIPGLPPPLEGLGGLPTIAMNGFYHHVRSAGLGRRQPCAPVCGLHQLGTRPPQFQGGGGLLQVDVVNRQNSNPYRGSFNFDGRYAGQSFADFLLGFPSSTSRATSNFVLDDINYRFAAFVQDDWRISPRVTLEHRPALRLPVGLEEAQRTRHVGSGAQHAGRGERQAGPDLERRGARGGRQHGGRRCGQLHEPGQGEFRPAPRVACRPFGTTRFVVRAAYGIYYNVMGEYDGAVDLRDLGLNPPFRASQTFLGSNTGVPNLRWTDAWAGTGSSSTSSPPNLYAVDKNFRLGYTQQWNYTMEWEPARNTGRPRVVCGQQGHALRAGREHQ